MNSVHEMMLWKSEIYLIDLGTQRGRLFGRIMSKSFRAPWFTVLTGTNEYVQLCCREWLPDSIIST